MCLKPPGFDSNLIVHADLALFMRVWLGEIDYHTALRTAGITIDGPPALARDFPRWLLWSPMSRHIVAERERWRAKITSQTG